MLSGFLHPNVLEMAQSQSNGESQHPLQQEREHHRYSDFLDASECAL